MEHKNSMGSRIQIRKIKGSVYFPTLLSKLVFIYISILITILVVLFVTFTSSFQAFFVEYTQDIMLNQAKGIAKEYEQASKYSTSREEAVMWIRKRIEMMDDYLQATTWLLAENGISYEFGVGDTVEFVANTLVEKPILQEVLSGNIISYENGFKDYFSVPVLTIGYPITAGDTIQYALFIHTPMPYVLQTIEAVRLLILRVVTFAGTILFGVIYLIAKQMTRPLKEMNSAAKSIAHGSLKNRIMVEGKDEIAQLGESLNHMAEALDKIEENRKSFIASISHDLRSPLTSISGFVTAILDGTIDSAHQEKYLKTVLSETQRLITMTNAILDLNRMQENTPIKKSVFNINQMIMRLLMGFEKRCEQKRINIYTDLEETHAYVFAQQDGINRVIQNLLENAYKFVEEGGEILIRTKVQKDKLWVSVLNNGPVIPPEQQQLIWERFYKGDASRGQDKNGIGLGLVIVKEIIKQNKEEIGVSSKEGEMVEFYFSLTLAKEE